jgi:hypothetical protein
VEKLVARSKPRSDSLLIVPDREAGAINNQQNLTASELPTIQRRRCIRLERFFRVEESIFCYQDALGYSWRCKFSQRWRCNLRSKDWVQVRYIFMTNETLA